MALNLITVYVAYETVNEYGRIGALILVSPERARAEDAAKGRGWWGSDGLVVEKTAVVADANSVFLLEKPTRYPLDTNIPDELAARKTAARAKLTDEEAKLLGIH